MSDSDKNRILQTQLTDLIPNIAVSKTSVKRSKKVMQNVTKPLLDGLKADHDVKYFEYAGGAYEGTKILAADEFDVMVVFDGNKGQRLVAKNLTPGYATLRPNDSSAAIYNRFRDEGTGYLSPDIAIQKFFGMVQKQVNKLEFRETVTVSRHGPAVMLTILGDHGKIEVDLVPTFKIGEDLYVAKPYKNYADSAETSVSGVPTNLFWRTSTSIKEKRTLCKIDILGDEAKPEEGCLRKCLKVFKYMRARDPTLSRLTSFHFKNLVLAEAKKTNEWRTSNMAERFMGLLSSLDKSLDSGCLQHNFLPEVNLLDGISPITRENIQGRVRGLINSPQARQNILQYRSIQQ